MNEVFPLERAAEAYERMIGGKARSRVVLVTGSYIPLYGFCTAGTNSPIKMAMMAMTTRVSTPVNPFMARLTWYDTRFFIFSSVLRFPYLQFRNQLADFWRWSHQCLILLVSAQYASYLIAASAIYSDSGVVRSDRPMLAGGRKHVQKISAPSSAAR